MQGKNEKECVVHSKACSKMKLGKVAWTRQGQLNHLHSHPRGGLHFDVHGVVLRTSPVQGGKDVDWCGESQSQVYIAYPSHKRHTIYSNHCNEQLYL